MGEITPLSHWLSGESVFIALEEALKEFISSTPKDHDIIVQAFDITVREIRYIEPHTFLFSGIDKEGLNTSVVAHYSQFIAHIKTSPKQDEKRIVPELSRQVIE